MKTEDILNEREKTHGDFEKLSELVGKFRELGLVYRREGQSASQQIALEMIYLKLARIICGDPNYIDHWDDIAGYAMLGKGEKKKNNESLDVRENESRREYCSVCLENASLGHLTCLNCFRDLASIDVPRGARSDGNEGS